MKSPAHTISDLLSREGIGSTDPSTTAWKIQTGRQGDSPDQHITVFDTGGTPNNPAFRINYPSIQVRVRGAKDDYPNTWTMINDIVEFLNGLTPQDLDGARWSGIIMIGGINSLGYDKVSRPEFTVNFRCFVEPDADSSPHMHRESL